MATYTTVDNVAEQLGFPAGYFTTTTTPTTAAVEKFITRSEDRIDSRTGHAWREKTVNNEYTRASSLRRYEMGMRFNLIHRSIRTISKLEIWENGGWNDWVANKTEGRDEDYWLDYKHGAVFLLNIHRVAPHGVRVTYTYGETTVSGGIEDCATMMAAMKILNSPEFRVALFTQAGETKMNWDSEKDHWKLEIESVLGNNQEFQ